MNLDGANVLVTGGTGSFGNEFVSKIMHSQKPARIIVYSRDELKQSQMRQRFPVTDYPNLRMLIGDVRDRNRVFRVMEGVDIVVAARGKESLENTAAALAEETERIILPIVTDTGNDESVRNMVKSAKDRLGHIDILVNCVGGSTVVPDNNRPVEEFLLDEWERMVDFNLKATFLYCKAVLPHMKKRGTGKIVNLSSIASTGLVQSGAAYSAAKGGIISLTQVLAGKYARDGIRVNAIAPGIVLSERVADRLGIEADATREEKIAAAQQMKGRLVESRHRFGFGLPEDIANIALFLVSEESRMVNGAVIPAEGGAARY